MHELTASERKKCRAIAMNLKPAILIGKEGISEALLAEANKAFARNPVVKIRLLASEREARKALLADFAERTQSTVCGEVGHTATLFRPKTAAASPLENE